MLYSSNKDEESYGCKSEIRESCDNQFFDEFKPFTRPLCKEPHSMKQDIQSDITSQISIAPQQNLSDSNQLFSFKNNINKNFLDLLKIKQIIFRFKTNILKQTQFLSTEEKTKQLLNGLKIERYLEKKNINSIAKSKLIFDTNNPILLLFDKIVLLLIFILLILIPFVWSFLEEESTMLSIINLIGTIILTIDAFLKLNTSIIVKGNIIKDRFKIFKIRLSSFLFQDLLFVICLNSLNSQKETLFLVIFFIAGFLKFSYYFDNQIENFNFPQYYLEIISLIKLLIIILLAGHAIACIWHFVGTSSYYEFQINWITVKNLENESVYTHYIYSFYWAIVTMVTVGYGDITPQNTTEVLSCTFIMFLSCGVYAFSLNKIGQVIQNLSDLQAQKRELMRAVSSYMKYHSISSQLQCRVRNYIEYQQNQKSFQSNVDVQHTIDSLSSDLKNEIMFNVFSNLINSSPLLLQNFSPNTIKKISPLLKLYLYSPGDTIYQQNDSEENSLFFVDYGTIAQIESKSNTTICEFKRGQCFGEYSFFTTMPKVFETKSLTFSRVYVIKRTDFISMYYILMTRLNIEEYEQFKEIGHQFLLNQPIKGYKCQLCDQNTHYINNCKQLAFIPNIEKIILKYRLSYQSRSKFKRGQREKSSCLNDLERITKSQNEIVNNQDEKSGIFTESDISHELVRVQQKSKQTLTIVSSQKNENPRVSIQLNKYPFQNQQCQDENNDIQHNNSETLIVKQENSKHSPIQIDQQYYSKTNLDGNPQKYFKKQTFQYDPESFKQLQDDYDRMKIYTKFFPHNNFNLVIEHYNLYNKYVNKMNKTRSSKYFLFSTKLRKDEKIEQESQRKTSKSRNNRNKK